MRRLALLLVLAAIPAGAVSPLAIVRSISPVADGVNALNPKLLPGSTADVALTVTDPAGNGLAAVAAIKLVEPVPAGLSMRVADYGAAGSGPVEFADGNLLGTGLLGSGVGYRFASLASMADGIEFSRDGADWSYVPVPDADGYDPRVRAIRVSLTGTQAAGTSFRLRYRVRIN